MLALGHLSLTDERFTREQILAVFGVTEDDLEELERIDGYQAARKAADAEREAFVARLRSLTS